MAECRFSDSSCVDTAVRGLICPLENGLKEREGRFVRSRIGRFEVSSEWSGSRLRLGDGVGVNAAGGSLGERVADCMIGEVNCSSRREMQMRTLREDDEVVGQVRRCLR